MNRIAMGVAVLLLVWPPLRGEDKPVSLRQQYDALVKKSQRERQDFNKALREAEAKTDEEQLKIIEEYKAKTRRIAAGFLALVEKAPKDPVAIDALSNVFAFPSSMQEKKKAAVLTLRDYLQSDKIAPICQSLAEAPDDNAESVLRALLAKSPHKSIQAEASFALAQMLSQRFLIAKYIKQTKEYDSWIETYSGKDVAEELRNKNMDAMGRATEKAWNEFAQKYSADIPSGRLTMACFQLSQREAKEVEAALRTLEKDKRREIQGIAYLALGQILKRRTDSLAEKDAKAAAKLRDESAEALRCAADKYGEVKIQFGERAFGGVIGEKAKKELYELLHLSIGMKAPAIDAEDQDGKKFKLSDYKGKVVLLDFWSQY